jgi:hypothetical protein
MKTSLATCYDRLPKSVASRAELRLKMAKGLKTRQKLMFRTDGLRPRNPVAQAARKRSAGPHQPGAGARRPAAQRRLKRLLSEN